MMHGKVDLDWIRTVMSRSIDWLIDWVVGLSLIDLFSPLIDWLIDWLIELSW